MDDINFLIVGYDIDKTVLDYILYEVVNADRDKVRVLSYKYESSVSKKTKDSLIGYAKDIKPTCVITLGGTIAKGLYNFTGSISNFRGNSSVKEGYPVMPTFSTKYIEKNPSKLEIWAKDIQKAYSLSKGIIKGSTQIVLCDTMDKIDTLIDYCKQTGIASFDFETTAIDKKKGVLAEGFYATTLSISFQIGSAYVIPLYHHESPYSSDEVKYIFSLLKKSIFENPDIRKIAHNLNYDYHVLSLYGINKLRGRIDDTMLMSHLNNELDKGSLKYLVGKYFTEFEGYDSALSGCSWADIPLSILAQYNGTDTDLTLRLCILLESYLQDDERIYRIYRNLTMPSFRALWEAEREGMLIDYNKLSSYVEEVDILVEDQEAELNSYRVINSFNYYKEKSIRLEAIKIEKVKLNKRVDQSIKQAEKRQKSKGGGDVSDYYTVTAMETKIRDSLRKLKSGDKSVYSGLNYSSPSQLVELLYTSEYGFKFKSYKNKTGKKYLLELEDKTGFIDGFLAYKSMCKMNSTYLKGLMYRLDKNNRVHTHFKINGTVTGRLCVGVDTLITTNRGLVRIGDLIPNIEGTIDLKGYKALTHTGKYQDITHGINKGYEKMYRVELESGNTIDCTENHKFLTKRGWSPLSLIATLIATRRIALLDNSEGCVSSNSYIHNITPLGEKIVADITVEEDHSYVGNGIVNHNSSVGPNLQNCPNPYKVKNEKLARVVRMVKDVFVPPENHSIIQLDYSQAELRVIASFAQEENMLSVYRDDGDIHSATAAHIAGIPLKDFDRTTKKDGILRQNAKVVNFGLIYGMGAEGFKTYAKDEYGIIMSLKKATETRDEFFDLYPSLKDYHDTYINKARQYGWVRTLFGRRRRTPDINSDDEFVRAMDERNAINSPIQGTAGEFTIFAIALLHLRLPERYKIVNTIHDSIMLYVPKGEVDNAINMVTETMGNLPTDLYFDSEIEASMKAEADVSEVSWGDM